MPKFEYGQFNPMYGQFNHPALKAGILGAFDDEIYFDGHHWLSKIPDF